MLRALDGDSVRGSSDSVRVSGDGVSVWWLD